MFVKYILFFTLITWPVLHFLLCVLSLFLHSCYSVSYHSPTSHCPYFTLTRLALDPSHPYLALCHNITNRSDQQHLCWLYSRSDRPARPASSALASHDEGFPSQTKDAMEGHKKSESAPPNSRCNCDDFTWKTPANKEDAQLFSSASQSWPTLSFARSVSGL